MRTEKENQLVLKEISSRLPFGVCVRCIDDPNHVYDVVEVNENGKIKCTRFGLDASVVFTMDVNDVQLILRHMRDMNVKEKEDYHRMLALQSLLDVSHPEWLTDFFNKNSLDYRNLIGRKLAVPDFEISIDANSNP